MKVGSLVVVKPLNHSVGKDFGSGIIMWLPIQDENHEYVLRGLVKHQNGEEGWVLEEGIIGYNVYSGIEFCLKSSYLREVQPPMDISEIIEDAIYEVVETKLKH